MWNLMNVYDCHKCGKVLSDETVYGEDIDTENDEVYGWRKCNKCHSDVTQRYVDGVICYEEVDDERARWAAGYYDEPKPIEYDDDF